MRRVVFAAVAAAGLVVRVFSQAPQTTFRASVDLVQIEVSVLDKSRTPVRGLAVTDFSLEEDGKARPVAAFSAVDPMTDPREAPAWTRSASRTEVSSAIAQEGRLVVILLDRSIPDGFPAVNARNIAKKAIDELAPGDVASVVYTGAGTSLGFTNDRARLYAAIGATAAEGLAPAATEKWSSLQNWLEAELQRGAGDARLPRTLPAFENVSGQCLCGACTLNAIRQIANAIRDVPARRKVLLFIGTDITLETTQSICIDPVHKARTAMFDALDVSGITVHSLDASGLETLAVQAGSTLQGSELAGPTYDIAGNTGSAMARRSLRNLSRQSDLGVLPDRTGGRAVLNTNQPLLRIPEILAESASYYLLGFQPKALDGKRHNVKVKVKRRGVEVVTRRAHVAASSDVPAR